MSIIKITAGEDGKGKRLDMFLVEKYPEHSRSFWQKAIKTGQVTITGEPAKVHEFLKERDEIEIINDELRMVNKKIKILKYKLIFECPDYLIIEKPAGTLTHRAGSEPGLADKIAKDYPEIKKVGEEGRWGIVHRLDREVSGVMMIARTEKFYQYIKKQFEERGIRKVYLGLVYGEVPKDDGDLNFVIGRGEDGKMAARPAGEEGREARTHFEVIERFKNYTYLQIQIFTGRTHQIRAHMLAYGHPVAGDKIYALRKQKIKPPEGLERIFLHSHILGFVDMDGKAAEYKSKLPRALEECLKKLR
jgi:23S rRNA pseudouridine1911/1915/1917 synthase